jgi:peptidyl-prolyl cis-trans isomerase D
MINSLRNFAKTKFAGLLVFIMIIPFVFWGMGGMFSSGNTNNVAKINDKNISTQDFINHINQSNIPEQTIRENLDKNIIEELLSTLVSTTLLDLEVKDFDILISENTLFQMIKSNQNFHDDNGNFERIKYEKFLLENNQSAPGFEARLRNRELQKSLFDFVGAGTVSPNFLVKKLYNDENRNLEIEFIDLSVFYKKKSAITDQELENFVSENKDNLKVEYLDFDYLIINPSNLIGSKEFDQAFFDKIDQIEIDISNDVSFNNIVSKLDIKPIKIKNFKFSSEKNNIEKRIFDLRTNEYDIFENDNNFILYKIRKIEERGPDLNDTQTRKEVIELVSQKNKFDYNRNLLEKVSQKNFNDDDFKKLGQNNIQTLKLNSIKDNKKFDINSVEVLYSLQENSFTLINDEQNNVYLAKIKKFNNKIINENDDKFNEYANKLNSNTKNSILKSYDLFLNNKYDVTLNKKTLERVKNYFK